VNPHILEAIFFWEPLLRPIAAGVAVLGPGAERPAIQAVDKDYVGHRCRLWDWDMECDEPQTVLGCWGSIIFLFAESE
jgi:hypothetical protein